MILSPLSKDWRARTVSVPTAENFEMVLGFLLPYIGLRIRFFLLSNRFEDGPVTGAHA